MTGPGGRLSQMVAELRDQGVLTEQAWRDALYAIPRDVFVPARAWCAPPGPGYPIDREKRPDEWLNAAYALDTAIVTQLDDGATDVTSGAGDYTSSLSGAGVIVEMLELLDPYDGDKVMEIGTGTGWTAALLAHRLGSERITSLEIDRDVVEVAKKNIDMAGVSARVIARDGAEGNAEEAPFDRVHVTCGIRQIPYAWVAQTRSGGMIVLPWRPGFDGHLMRLVVSGDGTAVGRFYGAASDFMMMRNQRVIPAFEEKGQRESLAKIDPRRMVRASLGADVALAATLPGVSCQTHDTMAEDEKAFHLWLWDDSSGVHVVYSPDRNTNLVRQFGPRSLWDEAESAFLRWVSWGSPRQDRFGITVTPDGQEIWLDRPDNAIK